MSNKKSTKELKWVESRDSLFSIRAWIGNGGTAVYVFNDIDEAISKYKNLEKEFNKDADEGNYWTIASSSGEERIIDCIRLSFESSNNEHTNFTALQVEKYLSLNGFPEAHLIIGGYYFRLHTKRDENKDEVLLYARDWSEEEEGTVRFSLDKGFKTMDELVIYVKNNMKDEAEMLLNSSEDGHPKIEMDDYN